MSKVREKLRAPPPRVPEPEEQIPGIKNLSRDEVERALASSERKRLHELNHHGAGRADDTLPAPIDGAEFVAAQLETPVELVKGVLHKGSKLVVGGASKSYKTWTLLDFGLSVATGTEWLGIRTAKGKVLFVNFEIQAHAWQKRIKTVAHEKGIKLQPGMVRLWNLRGHAADSHTLLPKIAEQIRNEHFSLIILDPIYKLYGNTDENSAGDVAKLLNAIEQLAVQTGAAVAFAAHFAKGNSSTKEAIDRISGSGVFARDPDSLLIFTEHEDEGAFVVEMILRNFPPVKPFCVRWEFPLMSRNDELNPADLKKRAGRRRDYSPDDVLKLLPAQGLTNVEWLKKAKAEHGMSQRTFYNIKKKSEEDKQIYKDGDKWKRNPKQVQ